MTAGEPYRQWGVFTADGRFVGTWDSLERARLYAPRYGDDCVIRWRDVTYTDWTEA